MWMSPTPSTAVAPSSRAVLSLIGAVSRVGVVSRVGAASRVGAGRSAKVLAPLLVEGAFVCIRISYAS
jgi:hypothetical protein